MTAAELVEQIKDLSARERRRLVEMLLEREEDPKPSPALRRAKWPDVEARAKRILGNKIMPNLVLMERGESAF